MHDKEQAMTHMIIDRRKNDKGKSSVNRQKFIRRVKSALRESVKDLISEDNLHNIASNNGKKVRIPARDLSEPSFHHGTGGIRDLVLPGNREFMVGDKINRPPSGNSSSGTGGYGEGEDEFVFHLSKDEFLDLFFDMCELPDLIKENIAVLAELAVQRSGFSSAGSPSQMNIMRSIRNAKSRRSGLKAAKQKKLKELQAQLVELQDRLAQGEQVQDQIDSINQQIAEVERRLKKIPYIDPVDLRFNAHTVVETPKLQAAMICLMDVSGSMDETRKQLAKMFYLLLYLFLERSYDKIAIEYIIYHSTAKVVDEESFYYGTESGGTIVSSGTELAYKTIMEKYNPSAWNVYMAHCSDGDSWDQDNEIVYDHLVNKLLPILQYYAYVEISPEDAFRFSFGDDTDESSLWRMYKPLSEQRNNLDVAKIVDTGSVYPVFIKLFERKT